jgi:hypothetical protein
MHELNRFSSDFAEVLFGIYPDWRQFALIEPDGSLVVKVSPPAESDIAHPLLITTDGDEVTIGLDHYHSHFYWPDDDQPSPFVDSLMFIATILSDEVAVVSCWKEGRWIGSTCIGPFDEVANARYAGSHARVRSWSGSRKRDFDIPPH